MTDSADEFLIRNLYLLLASGPTLRCMQLTVGVPDATTEAPERDPDQFQIHVIYTDPEETKAALARAEHLSSGLDTRLSLILTPIVPFPLSLDAPPAPVEFFLDRIRSISASIERDVVSYIYFCRDPLPMIKSALRPHSLLVIGARSRWFLSRSRRLARALRRCGHDVVVTPQVE